MEAQLLIDRINQDSENNKLFWVAGLARETWTVLKNHKDKLHPSALMAVEHYESVSNG